MAENRGVKIGEPFKLNRQGKKGLIYFPLMGGDFSFSVEKIFHSAYNLGVEKTGKGTAKEQSNHD